MANAKRSSSPEEQEIIAGQNEWDQFLPKSHAERVALLDRLTKVRQNVNDEIAQVKKDAGLSDIERTLTEQSGYTPQAIKIIAMLEKMPARACAKTIRQVNGRMEDKGRILPDMFDQASTAAREDRPQEPAAQQRSPEEMAASHETETRDPLEVQVTAAEAREQLEAYLKEHPRRRGTKPKELVRLDDQLAAALAREGAEPDNVVNLGGHMRGTADAGEAHIKAQIAEQAKKGQEETAKQPAEPDPAPEKPAKKPRGKKAAETPAAETAPAAKNGPPKLDDESEDEEAPPEPGAPIGTASPSFSMA